jgi:hypothetical protein
MGIDPAPSVVALGLTLFVLPVRTLVLGELGLASTTELGSLDREPVIVEERYGNSPRTNGPAPVRRRAKPCRPPASSHRHRAGATHAPSPMDAA